MPNGKQQNVGHLCGENEVNRLARTLQTQILRQREPESAGLERETCSTTQPSVSLSVSPPLTIGGDAQPAGKTARATDDSGLIRAQALGLALSTQMLHLNRFGK